MWLLGMVDRELLGGCLDCVGLGLSVTHKIFQLICCFGHNQKTQNVAEAVGNGGGGGGGGGETMPGTKKPGTKK